MKKIIALLLMFVMMVGLTGCTSIQIGYIEKDSKGKMSASYVSYSGSKKTTIEVTEGQSVEVSVDIETKKGVIDVLIYKDKNDNNYEGHEIQTSNFTVTLDEPGEYTLLVETKKHKGSYTFEWDQNPS